MIYRTAVKQDEVALAAWRFADATRCVVRFERSFMTPGVRVSAELGSRWLAQDAADKDTGFAEQGALYREIMAPLQPFFVGEYKTYRCDVKYTDIGA